MPLFVPQEVTLDVCEECENELLEMGFERDGANVPHSAVPFPIRLKGESKIVKVHNLKLTKNIVPDAELKTVRRRKDSQKKEIAKKDTSSLEVDKDNLQARREEMRKKKNNAFYLIAGGFLIGIIGMDVDSFGGFGLLMIGGGVLSTLIGIVYALFLWGSDGDIK